MTLHNAEERNRADLQSSQDGFTTLKLIYGPEAQHFGELYLPLSDNPEAGPYPVVILIHGGFWRIPYDLTLMNGLAESLARQGIAAWNIEYRRIGEAGGGWPGTFQDVALAADRLRDFAPAHALDLQRIVAVGHSAGGQLALWLAARVRIPLNSPVAPVHSPLLLTGVVSLAGAVDLAQTWQLNLGRGAAAELLGGSPQQYPDRYAATSPAALLPLGLPQVLVHGSADDRVPLVVSQDYARRAREAGDDVTLIELPGADHFVLIDPASDAWARTVEQISRLLTLQAPGLSPSD
ncbi:MAG: alpha/beta hydrolase [Ktedonobacteraceae bacterium]|nr:alpha/beta hydrolase [Ktedonobacteraceae bacterium]